MSKHAEGAGGPGGGRRGQACRTPPLIDVHTGAQPESEEGLRWGEQLLRAYFRSKRAKRKVYELGPLLFGTSAENPGTTDRSELLSLLIPGG